MNAKTPDQEILAAAADQLLKPATNVAQDVPMTSQVAPQATPMNPVGDGIKKARASLQRRKRDDEEPSGAAQGGEDELAAQGGDDGAGMDQPIVLAQLDGGTQTDANKGESAGAAVCEDGRVIPADRDADYCEGDKAGIAPLWGGLLALGGAALAGGGGGSGGGGSSGGGNTPNTSSGFQLHGQIAAGLVQAGTATITVYDRDGKALASNVAITADGQYSVQITGYTGPVLVVLNDANAGGSNYVREVDGNPGDLGATRLRAMGNYTSGSELIVNITPITELAVRAAGVAAGSTTPPASSAAIDDANAAVGKAFGGIDILHGAITTTTETAFNQADGVNPAERYGIELARLDALDRQTGGMEQSLTLLASGIAVSGGNATLTTATQKALHDASVLADDIVGSALDTKTVLLADHQIGGASGVDSAIAAVVAFTQANGGTAPTLGDYANAGITGVDTGKLAGINSYLAGPAVAGKNVDTVAELQAFVNAYNALLSGAAGGTAPTLGQLQALGMSGVTASNLAAVQAAIAANGSNGTGVDSVGKLQAIIDAVNTPVTPVDPPAPPVNPPAPPVNPPSPPVNPPTDPIAEAINAISTAAQNNSATATSPSAATYAAAGVTGVSTDNLAAINDALNSAAVDGAATDTSAEIQAVVNAYQAILVAADGTDNNAANPSQAQYAAIGVTGVDSAVKTSLLGDVIDIKANADVDTVAEVQALADAVAAVMAGAGGGTAPTQAQLQALGLTGVTAGNLATIQAAIAATADDGSGVDTLAELQGIVDTVNTANNAISAAAQGNNATAASPSAATYAAAGVTGVDAGNLAAINSALNSAVVDGAAADTPAETQAIVNSYNAILAAAGGLGSAPVAQDYTNIGVTGVTMASAALLGDVIGDLAKTAVDTVAEVQALAAAAAAVMSGAAGGTAPTLAQLQALGLTGLTAGNLAAVQAAIAATADDGTGVDTRAELQALVDAIGTAVETISGLAQANTATASTPSAATYAAAGVTGVSTDNLAAINDALNSAAVDGAATDTSSEIQAVVNAYQAILVAADGTDNNAASPSQAQYAAIGVIGVDSAVKTSLLGDVIDIKANADVDTVAEVQALADAVAAVMAGAGGGTAPTLEQLQALGLTGVTAGNLAAVQAAIAATADDGTGVDTLAELQAVVAAGIAGPAAALDAIKTAAEGNTATATEPSAATYAAAGITGVSADNLAAINDALNSTAVDGAAVDTVPEIQALVDSYNAILGEANGAAADATPAADPSAQDYATIGASIGLAATDAENLALLNDIVGAQDKAGVDTIAEIDELARIANAVQAYAAGTPSDPALTAADFTKIGITGVTADNLGAILDAIGAQADTGTATDSLAELQALVTSYNAILGEANDSDSPNTGDTVADATPAADPSAQDYANIGASIGLAATDAENLALLNDIVGAQDKAGVDTIAEINELARIANAIQSYAAGTPSVPALTADDLAKIGLTGVTAENLAVVLTAIGAKADDGTATDSLPELQALVDQTNTSVSIISALAEANTATPTTPGVNTYKAAGVSGVSADNLAAINSALDSAAVNGAATDTAAEIQALVNSYNAILGEANDSDSPNTGDTVADATPAADPSAQDYANIGVVLGAAATDAENLALLNDIVGAQTKAGVDTVAEVQALADFANLIQTVAAGAVPSPLPAAQDMLDGFGLIGLTGVTAANLPAVLAAIAAQADDGKGTDSLAELQALINGIQAATAVTLDFTGVADGLIENVAAVNLGAGNTTILDAAAVANITDKTGAAAVLTLDGSSGAVLLPLSGAGGFSALPGNPVNIGGAAYNVYVGPNGEIVNVSTHLEVVGGIVPGAAASWSIAAAGDADESAGALNFTVTRVGDLSVAATIQVASGGGSATAGSDYTAVTQTLSFAAGEASKVVSVSIADDTVAEPDETVVVTLSNPSAGAIATASASAAILDNEQSIWRIESTGAVDEGAGTVSFTVSRSGASGAASIEFATANGTALAGSDYTAKAETLSFGAGEMSKTVTVAITDDAVFETQETFSGRITNASSGVIAADSAVAAINDNEQSSWSITGNGAVDEAAGTMSFTVSRNGATGAATIEFTTSGGSATAGADYTAAHQTLSFAAGETSKTVSVAIANDTTPEADETVGAVILNASSGTIVSGGAANAIIDNDQSVWSVSAPASVDEGAGSASVTVSRSGAVAAATIVLTTAGGTATAGADYTDATQTLSFAAGEMSKTVKVAITDDTAAEPNETFDATIGNASSGTLGAQSSARIEIQDNEQAIWNIAVDQGSVAEGAGTATFTVTRSGKTDAAETIVVTSGGGIATASSDYTAIHQTLSFAAGETRRSVMVDITQDGLPEANESFNLTLSGASAGDIKNASAAVTILDDDQAVWSIAAIDSAITESSGSAAFTVSRTGATDATGIIEVAFGNGSATAGSDYTATTQILTFAPGEMAKIITTPILNEFLKETSETFFAILQNPGNASVIDGAAGSAGITILDDDNVSWTVVANDQSVSETAGTASFTVARTGNIQQVDTIVFQTTSSSASEGSDYVPLIRTLTFASGESAQTVAVQIVNDNVGEADETLTVAINNQSNGTVIAAAENLNPGSASTVIVDDDQIGWRISAAATTVAEGAGVMSFTVNRSGSFETTETIVVQSGGGDATAVNDYDPLLQTLSFAPGQTTQTVNVVIHNDMLPEADETFGITIGDASKGTILASSAMATILDDDNMIWTIYAPDGSGGFTVDEGAGTATVVVARSGNINTAQTIVITTGSNTNTCVADYTPLNQTLSFAAGEASKNVQIAITDDGLPEAAEGLYATIHDQSTGNLGEYRLGTLAGSVVSIGIEDNDQSQWKIRAVGTGSVEEDAGNAAFEVSRSGDITQAGTIVFSTSAGSTAQAGSDYTAVLRTLSFAAGEASRVVTVPVTNDTQPESNETLVAFILNPSTGTLRSTDDANAVVTLIDNDSTNWLLQSTNSSVSEAAGVAPVSVIRQGDVTGTETVVIRTAGITAIGAADANQAGADYVQLFETLTFNAGETQKTVNIALVNDSVAESLETLRVALMSPSTGAVDGTQGGLVLTIHDDDTVGWSVSRLADAPEAAGQQMYWAVSRTGDSSVTATIEVHTEATGNDSQPGIDYTPVHRTLTFLPGQTQQVVGADVISDTIAEGFDQLVGLVISNPSTGGIVDAGIASARIMDDDASELWVLRIPSATVNEGDSVGIQVSRLGTDINTTASVVVNLMPVSASAADYDAGAAGFDTHGQQTLTFAPGQAVGTIYLPIVADSLPENTETLRVFLSGLSGNQRMSTSSAGLTVTLNDRDSVNWSVAGDGYSNEADGVTIFSVRRSGNLGGTDTIVVESGESCLQHPESVGMVLHEKLLSTLTFHPGETLQTVPLTLINDSINRSAGGLNLVRLSLESPSTGNITTASAITNVFDDDLPSPPIWQISPTSTMVGEGDSKAFFAISRLSDTSQTATIEFTTTDPTTAATTNNNVKNGCLGEDYACNYTTLTFLPGVATLTVGVDVVQDGVAEGLETMRAIIANPSLGRLVSVGFSQATATIVDDEAFSWSILESPLVSESSGTVGFRVGRNGAGDTTATVVVQTLDGTARAGVDYEALAPTTLTFTPGEANKTVAVRLLADDAVIDGNKVFQLAMSEDSSPLKGGLMVATPFASATIMDDELMNWSVANVDISTESNAFQLLLVQRSGDVSSAETIVLTTGSGTAARGVAYDDATQTLSFAAGQTSQTVRVNYHPNDIIGEPLTATPYTGTYFVSSLSGQSKGVLATANVTTTILDDDQCGSIFISEAFGNEGTGLLTYRVSRNASMTNTDTVVVGLKNTSIDSVAGVDFNPYLETLTFAPGEYTKNVIAKNIFIDDPLPENEGYALYIDRVNGGSSVSFASGANIALSYKDDDGSQWAISTTSSASEGLTNAAAFMVSRVGAIDQAATVVVRDIGGTAQAGADYTPLLQTLSFAPGVDKLSVTLATLDDSQREVAETVTAAIMSVSSGRTVSGQSAATFTINDNDFDRVIWNVTMPRAGLNEAAGVATFTISRSSASSTETIVYQTSGSSFSGTSPASPGSDFTPIAPTTLTFGIGELNKTVNVAITDDTRPEENETLSLLIYQPSSGIVGTGTVYATIYDDDRGPVFSVEGVSSIVEPKSGSVTGYFSVLRTRDISQTDTVVFETAGSSTATEGVDFTTVGRQTLTFAPGVSRQFATIEVLADNVVEGTETVVGSISGASRGSLSSSTSSLLTILDADQPMTWAVASTNGVESADGVATLTVTRSGKTDVASTVVVQSSGIGTATPGVDFVPLAPTTLSFAAGETTGYVSVKLLSDTLSEPTETIGIALSDFSHGTAAAAGSFTTMVSIIDDDRVEWSVASLFNPSEAAGNALLWKVSRSTQGTALDSTETVVVQTVGGTASGGSDYAKVVPTTLTFLPGETEKVVSAAVYGDSVIEGNETVILGISDVSHGQVATATATATIVEIERLEWTLSAGNAVVEGDRMSAYVIRANDLSTTETVVVSVAGGSAMPGVDFTNPGAQTLTFLPGQTRQAFSILTTQDALVEANETVITAITGVSRGHVVTGAQTATITDDDNTRTLLTIASQGAADKRGGNIGWTITRSGSLAGITTVEYLLGNTTSANALNNTSATVGSLLGTLTFNPGEAFKGVSIPLLDDGIVEANGNLVMNIQNASNAIITTGSAATAVNDAQAAVAATSFSVAGTAALDTAGSALFTITRAGNLSATSVVSYQTGTGTLAATSFTAESSTALTFAPGETVKTVAVEINNTGAGGTLQLQVDGNNDGTFSGSAPDANGTATITHDATAPSTWSAMTIPGGIVFESAGHLEVQLARAGDASGTATLTIQTLGTGTATPDTDFVALGLTTVTFAPGELTKAVNIDINDDSTVENNETIIISAVSQTGGSASLPANVTATILDDDMRVATSGNDTITLNSATGFGGSAAGFLVDAGDGNDNITLATTGYSWADVRAGAGDDVVHLPNGATGSAMFIAGAHIDGGAGLDTLKFDGTGTTLNLRSITVNGTATGFEIIDLTGTGNNTLTVGINDLLDLTTGNTVACELRIDGNAGDVLNLAGLGITGQTGVLAPRFNTPTAETTITDVDNATTATVVASAAGDANANDVTIGAQTYDVYQFSSTAGLFTLLVDTDMTRNFVV